MSHLFNDVLEGILKPVVKSDMTLAVLVNGLEILFALGNASLEQKVKENFHQHSINL